MKASSHNNFLAYVINGCKGRVKFISNKIPLETKLDNEWCFSRLGHFLTVLVNALNICMGMFMHKSSKTVSLNA